MGRSPPEPRNISTVLLPVSDCWLCPQWQIRREGDPSPHLPHNFSAKLFLYKTLIVRHVHLR